ncbi:hypothetical protein OsI_14875 [Oryza sativa Indica Group]|uniref:Uncharacterized protein n=1 Tax=Oryza sativa subsp. indica TaxID=39946 RepID=B8AVB2_ORYSI|nr:hypothetical protein OsI_14875 [Oryza sativa Indica Group]
MNNELKGYISVKYDILTFLEHFDRMFVKIASRAAESDETYLMAANNAQKLAEDVEKYLSIRPDPDLDKSGTEENVGPSKARGIKVKEKAIRGSRRPIGGFDKATQQSKKKKSDSNTSKCPVQAEVVTPSLPYTMMQIQGRSEIPTNYNHMQMPDYYHVEGASLLQSSGYFELLNKVKGCSMKRLHRHLIHIPIACLPI